MPMRKLQLLPGVNTERTPTLNQTQLSQSNLIRFYNGLVEKRAGWQQMVATPLIGICSGLHGWSDIAGLPWLAAGTDQRLEVLGGGMLFDLTPVSSTTNPAVSFSTTISSATVTITDSGATPNAGDWINLQTQVSVGGIVLFGYYRITALGPLTSQYQVTAASTASSGVTNGGAVPLYSTTNTSATVQVTLNNHGLSNGQIFNALVSTTVATVAISGPYNITVVDANNFDITATSLANATTTGSENGGDARIQYLLPSGTQADTYTGTYGLGAYGGGAYGISANNVFVPMRQWALDNFGQDLIASPTNGAIYYWQPASITPAVVVDSSAPTVNATCFVMSQSAMIVALGSSVSGSQQPLLVRWCDAGDFTDWTATVTNQAGSFTIPQGSKLVGGAALGLGALLWTDIGLYAMTYQGLPFVFGFTPIAVGCGLLGSRAFAVNGPLVMWRSLHSFFIMSTSGGQPQAVECPVEDILLENADFTQPGQWVMGANTLANEFELFFPLKSSSPYYVANSVTRGSIKYNYVEAQLRGALNAWDYTISPQLQRTAWTGAWGVGGAQIGNPVGTDLASLIQQHELGYDANGQPIQWSFQTGDFDLAEGEEFVFTDWLIPDFNVIAGTPTVNIQVMARDAPESSYRTTGVMPWTQAAQFIPPFGIRGRQMAIQCSGNDAGTLVRLGVIRYRASPDGRGI